MDEEVEEVVGEEEVSDEPALRKRNGKKTVVAEYGLDLKGDQQYAKHE